MQNVLGVWSGLDTRRKVIVAVATLAMFVAVLVLSQMVSAKRLDLLYAGLEQSAAGDVVAALEQQGVVFEVRGSSIYVDVTRRDELRMILAGQGLPSNGSAGYELLDNLSGFGTTSQMFDAAYWRAKEGELARTIVTSPQIKSARVHISTPPTSGFRRNQGATASVVITPANAALTEANARALRFLVASAVPSLKPDQVSVIDSESGLVVGGEISAAVNVDKRAAALKRNVERLLEARVGPGNAVVELSLEAVTERESVIERHFDPEGRVAISTETEERNSTSQGASGGAVTVASNLPDGDAGSGGRDRSSQDSETRERVNFEVSETQREILRVPGAVKRLSVAVMVNAEKSIDGTGTEVAIQRSEEELNDLRQLIEAAVGFDESRGDQITIRSFEFQPLAVSGSAPTTKSFNQLDIMSLVQVAILALVALVLGLFVVRPILTQRAAPQMLELAPPPKAGELPALENSEALSGEVAGADEAASLPDIGNFGPSGGIGLPMLQMNSDDPVERLRQLIRDRQQDTVEVLKTWMEDDREKAR